MVPGGGRRFKKGTWGEEEDALLLAHVKEHGERCWNSAHQHFPDLNRSGKSCRLRYINQLHPDIVRGSITPCEERYILVAHSAFGNQWSRIAGLLPGRTDNFVKNVVKMRMEKARRCRAAASINSAARTGQMRLKREQPAYAPARAAVWPTPTPNHISTVPSACGLPQLLSAMQVGTHSTLDSSLGSYTALVASGGAGAAAEAGACMQAVPNIPGSSMMGTFTVPISSPMFDHAESKPVAEPCNSFNVAPPGSSSYNGEWPAMQAPLAVQKLQESVSGCTGMLPLVQTPFESALQVPSVQNLLYDQSSKLPSVPNVSSVSPQLTSMQEPLQSLEGLELPLSKL